MADEVEESAEGGRTFVVDGAFHTPALGCDFGPAEPVGVLVQGCRPYQLANLRAHLRYNDQVVSRITPACEGGIGVVETAGTLAFGANCTSPRRLVHARVDSSTLAFRAFDFDCDIACHRGTPFLLVMAL